MSLLLIADLSSYACPLVRLKCGAFSRSGEAEAYFQIALVLYYAPFYNFAPSLLLLLNLAFPISVAPKVLRYHIFSKFWRKKSRNGNWLFKKENTYKRRSGIAKWKGTVQCTLIYDSTDRRYAKIICQLGYQCFYFTKTCTSEEAESESGKVMYCTVYSVHSFMTPLTEDMQNNMLAGLSVFLLHEKISQPVSLSL